MEADGWDPSLMNGKSDKKVSWKCKSGHMWVQEVRTRTNRGQKNYASKCPGCISLELNYPHLLKEINGWNPSKVSFGSNQKKSWKCVKGHIWIATVKSRTTGDTGCPICTRRKIVSGLNDLLTSNKNLAIQAKGWDPSKYLAGSNSRKEWVCDKGHEFSAVIAQRSRGRGCPVCSGKKILKGINDLATTNPELAKELIDIDPTKINSGSNKYGTWKCKLNHTWKAQIFNRTTARSGCPYCQMKKVLTGFNDLKTLNSDLAKEAFDWDPSKQMPGSSKKVKWKCEKGHIWTAVIYSRVRGNGCPTCATTGYDPNENGYLYLLEHIKWEMLQIGISNNPEIRFKDHKRLGWDLIEVRGPMDGHLAQQWETAILRMLRVNQTDLANSSVAGKFNGFSEAWSKSAFPVKSIKELMKLTEEFEEKQ